MSQLEIEAINPVRTDSWRSLHWVARMGRWELTCGFCRSRFTRPYSALDRLVLVAAP